MSLIELFGLTLFIFCGYFVGHALGQQWGIAGWLIGVLAGSALGLLLMQAFVVTAKLYHRYRPLRLVCRQGKCGPTDYSLVKITPRGWLVRCRCGDTYLSKSHHFRELLRDASVRPYMARAPFRDWKPDVE